MAHIGFTTNSGAPVALLRNMSSQSVKARELSILTAPQEEAVEKAKKLAAA